MKSIIRKTKDNSGATIIMALLFMLICVMISTVLLATAGTASRDVSRQREQQRAYLAVSSAINVLKDEIESCKFSKNFDPDTLVNTKTGSAPSLLLLKTALGNAKSEKATDTSFQLSCNGNEDLNVNVRFKMTEGCRIYLTCWVGEESTPAYMMTATFTKNLKEDYYTWSLKSLSKGKG